MKRAVSNQALNVLILDKVQEERKQSDKNL